MSFSLWPALRARFWKRDYTSVYSGPAADIAVDNGFQDKVFDPNGVAMNSMQLSGTTRGRLHLNNPNGVSVSGALSTASAPTVTPTGGTASTWAYKIVARASNGTAAASSAGQTTAGVTTLTGSAYNTITWAAVSGASSYDIYRTTSATAPTSTGYIGNVLATAALSFIDTGITADGSTAPTVNTTGVFESAKYFDIAVIGLAAVQLTAITNGGTVGSTGYSYSVSAVTAVGTENGTAAAASTTTGNATLSATNFNTVTWRPVPGAISYNVYRTASSGTPGTTGLVANVAAVASATTVTVNDTGLTASGSVVTTDTTGSISSTGTDSLRLSTILDSNGNPELQFVATTSAVNGLVETNSATGNPVNLIPGAASGSDTNIGLTINSKGTGALTLAPTAAGGTIVIGAAAGTGIIGVGSSSATQVVNVGNGAGVSTVNLANVSVAGANCNIATAVTGAGITDTVAISTGNAAATGIKVVNIATGTPGTSGNNRVTIGGGATSAVTLNGSVRSYQQSNYIASETGANNALVAALLDAGGNAVTVAAGLCIWLKLGHSLQAGANTLNVNSHGTDSVKKTSNPATDLSVTAVSGSILMLIFDGTVWQVQGQ